MIDNREDSIFQDDRAGADWQLVDFELNPNYDDSEFESILDYLASKKSEQQPERQKEKEKQKEKQKEKRELRKLNDTPSLEWNKDWQRNQETDQWIH